MKQKRKAATKPLQILDNEENSDHPATYSNVTLKLSASKDNPSTSNHDITSPSTSSNNRSIPSSATSISRILEQLTSSDNHFSLSNDDTPSRQISTLNHFMPFIPNNNPMTPSSLNNGTLTFASSNDYFVACKSSSGVWKYAIKSDDGKLALCQLCNYSCSMASHSTSTIRYHLSHKHDKQDLIIDSSSSSTKSSVSERFKREIHALCYNAIVMDHRPFNDLRKKGIMAIFNKLCPGHWYKQKMEYDSQIIHFASFNERHTANNTANCIKQSLMNLDIYHKIVAITCDGGENLVAACRLLGGGIKRIWCCAHRLHLSVINSLGLWNKEEASGINAANNSSAQATITTVSSSNTTSNDEQELMDVNWNSQKEPESGDANTNDLDIVENDDAGSTSDRDNNIPNDENDDQAADEIANADYIYDNWSIDIDLNVTSTEEVELMIRVIKKCRKIATVSKKSYIISNFIRFHQASFKVNRTLNNDCKSRWNSTYSLIDSLIIMKPLLMKLFTEKRTLKLQKEQLDNLTSFELNNEDWDFLTSLHHVLKPFYLGTVMMSGKNYPSIGLSYHAVQKLKQFCTTYTNDNEHMIELKKLLLSKLYRYFYSDVEQYEHFQYHGFFDPVAHLTLSDNEKQQCERYVKNLIFSDVYPTKHSSVDGANTSLTTVSASSSPTVSSQLQNPSFQQTSFKSTTYDDFITACGDYDMVSESSKEKSKRVALNEEFKYFKTAVHAFNLKNKPSVTSALVFWKDHYVQLPLLSNLAKVHLVACGTSVPSESAFSCSAYVGRKERSRLSPENLAYSVFLKDKLDRNRGT